jgi:hypothetical protein
MDLALSEKSLNDIETRPGKALKCLAQETGEAKSSERRATQMVKLRLYKTAVIHAFQPCLPSSRVNFCSWFLQSIIEGEINL